MSKLNSQIREAIESQTYNRARDLVREALKDANAETYYLGFQVALNDQQRKAFLQKALDLDPLYAPAHREIQALLNSQIREAIESQTYNRARDLVREALKDANAETYYLASQVALNDQQRKAFLQKALDLDPFYTPAHRAIRAHNRAIATTALVILAIVALLVFSVVQQHEQNLRVAEAVQRYADEVKAQACIAAGYRLSDC